jgi:hypothetical protein
MPQAEYNAGIVVVDILQSGAVGRHMGLVPLTRGYRSENVL